MTTRREALVGLAGMMAMAPQLARAAGQKIVSIPFSWDLLQARAETLSRQPWKAPPKPSPLIEKLTYEAMFKVHYRAEQSLWPEGDGSSSVRFFPLTKMSPQAVSIAIVERGQATPFTYSPALYDAPRGHPMRAIGSAGGFSGFRVMNAQGIGDWLAFQGASYFRSAGPLHQYGLSARGLAIDTGINGPEEFPLFTHFWLEKGADGAIIVYALLDSPSATGAYRITSSQTGSEMVQDVSLVLHMRKPVQSLGIAPLTSMFWYGEGHRAQAKDWRPEIHDSDGLAIHTGAGERIWRPLSNPQHPKTNSFGDAAPRGFGLLQRDRDFDHYQDDAVFFEKRPSLWIEPKGDWGRGAVTLYEIPTAREYDDNIVAFWRPAVPTEAGQRLAYDYRMRWIGGEPDAYPAARVVNSWTGEGGVPGEPPAANARKLVVDFQGDRLAGLKAGSAVKPVIDVKNGKILNSGCYPVAGLENYWRLIVDVERASGEPVDIRAFLRMNGDALTETLIYQLS